MFSFKALGKLYNKFRPKTALHRALEKYAEIAHSTLSVAAETGFRVTMSDAVELCKSLGAKVEFGVQFGAYDLCFTYDDPKYPITVRIVGNSDRVTMWGIRFAIASSTILYYDSAKNKISEASETPPSEALLVQILVSAMNNTIKLRELVCEVRDRNLENVSRILKGGSRD